MNFKPELLAKVLAGEKTQTRRPVKPEHFYGAPEGKFTPGGVYRKSKDPLTPHGAVWHLNQDYAVCPGRGKKQVGRIRIISIRCEDVRNISVDDARAEGFEGPGEFLNAWCGFYDKRARWEFDPQRVDYWINTGKRRELVGWDTVLKIISARPAELYQAWVIAFELVR